jgi:hypothetical protein
MTDDDDDVRFNPFYYERDYIDVKTTDEMLQEINKGIDEQINISRDIREHLMVMDVRSEKYEDVPYKILGRLYEIIFRRNYQRGIFFVLLSILAVLCDVHYGFFDYVKNLFSEVHWL